MMVHDANVVRRRSIRLSGYDYSRVGAYFVTICVHDRVCLFGDVVNGEIRLNDAGRWADRCWREIPAHFPHMHLDEFIVMPNHIHGILIIVDPVGANNYSPLGLIATNDSGAIDSGAIDSGAIDSGAIDSGAIDSGANDSGANDYSPLQSCQTGRRPCGTSKTIGSVIRGFKIGITKWFRKNTAIENVWQRNYYERVIRNDDELNRIRKYIMTNPARRAIGKGE